MEWYYFVIAIFIIEKVWSKYKAWPLRGYESDGSVWRDKNTKTLYAMPGIAYRDAYIEGDIDGSSFYDAKLRLQVSREDLTKVYGEIIWVKIKNREI